MDLKSKLIKLKETLRNNIMLKSLDSDNINDAKHAESSEKTSYRAVEFKIIEVD